MFVARETLTSSGLRASLSPHSTEDLPAGSMLGAYQVLGLIGRGGMGSVYEVQDLGSGPRYAAKVLRRELSSEPSYIERFKREALAASRVKHAGIVEIVALEETGDGRVYMI